MSGSSLRHESLLLLEELEIATLPAAVFPEVDDEVVVCLRTFAGRLEVGSRGPPIPIENPGKQCYINCVVHLLSCTKLIRSPVEVDSSHSTCWAKELWILLANLRLRDNTAVDSIVLSGEGFYANLGGSHSDHDEGGDAFKFLMSTISDYASPMKEYFELNLRRSPTRTRRSHHLSVNVSSTLTEAIIAAEVSLLAPFPPHIIVQVKRFIFNESELVSECVVVFICLTSS